MRYTRREYETVRNAYLTLRRVVEYSQGDARILDNLVDMMDGDKPRWGKRALREGNKRNEKKILALVDKRRSRNR